MDAAWKAMEKKEKIPWIKKAAEDQKRYEVQYRTVVSDQTFWPLSSHLCWRNVKMLVTLNFPPPHSRGGGVCNGCTCVSMCTVNAKFVLCLAEVGGICTYVWWAWLAIIAVIFKCLNFSVLSLILMNLTSWFALTLVYIQLGPYIFGYWHNFHYFGWYATRIEFNYTIKIKLKCRL